MVQGSGGKTFDGLTMQQNPCLMLMSAARFRAEIRGGGGGVSPEQKGCWPQKHSLVGILEQAVAAVGTQLRDFG